MEFSRRNILKAGLLGATLSGVGAYAYARGPGRKRIGVRELDIKVLGLPATLDGFRIAQLSDFHIDPLMEQEFQSVAVSMANALRPDLIVLTGDFVSHKGEAVAELGPVVEKLEARLGVFACLGNHDCWTSPGKVTRGLDKAGIRVLKNDGVSFRSDDKPLFLAGLDSVWGGHAEPSKAFRSKRKDEAGILLCHEPDIFSDYAGEVPFSLMLSGHTHGGQVRFPGFGAPILPSFGKKYPYGLYRREGAQLYVNPGIGTVDQHVRLFCRPEISCFTLRAA